jgi:hypothetical protein
MALLSHFLPFRQVGIDWYPKCQLVRNVPTSTNHAHNQPGSWHFARLQLAQRYLQTFQIGLVSAQALFAPRRMGKSEFLEQDLIPAAQKSGLLTAYLNLWDAREHPRGALISALARAGAPRGLSALIKKLKAPLMKVKASAKLGDLHSLAARNRLGEELGLGKAAPLDTPKNALRRLQKDELVVKLEYGHYRIQDGGLAEWLRQLELEE